EGYYQLGEVRRRRGDADGAFVAFAQARALGIEPQPREALLRCSQGDGDTAWTDLRVALASGDRVGRMVLLPAAVRVALARDDLDQAARHRGGRWHAAPSTRRNGIAVNSNWALRRSGLRASGPGPRTRVGRYWCGGH